MAAVTKASHRIAVLGGGIAGLSAAYAARAAATGPLQIVLIESSDRLGGWLHSEREDGFLFERGCRGIRPLGSGRAATALVEELGLAEQTLAASSSSQIRYLWHIGKLEKLPGSLWEALRSPLTRGGPGWLFKDLTTGPRARDGAGLSDDDVRARGLLSVPPVEPSNCPGQDDGLPAFLGLGHGMGQGRARGISSDLADEPHATGSIDGVLEQLLPEDESVLSWASRRLDPFVGRVLLDAAFSGVYAGDVSRLSARAVMSRLWTSEAQHGGLVRAALAQALAFLRREGREAAAAPGLHDSPFVRACAASSSVSFVHGMSTLPRALAASVQASSASGAGRPGQPCRVTIMTGTEVLALGHDGRTGQCTVQLRSKGSSGSSSSSSNTTALTVDAVVSTLPAPVMARVLQASAAGLGAGSGASSSSTGSSTGTSASSSSIGNDISRPAVLARTVHALSTVPFASVGLVCVGWRHGSSTSSSSNGPAASTSAAGGSSRWPAVPAMAGGGFGYLVPSGERGPLLAPGHAGRLLAEARAYAGPSAASSAAASSSSSGQAPASGSSAPSGSPAQPPAVPVLGMVWDSAVFPGQSEAWIRARAAGAVPPRPQPLLPVRGDEVWESARQSETRVSVMLGGAPWPGVEKLSQDDLKDIGQAALAVHTRPKGHTGPYDPPRPEYVHASVAKSAIPQYDVGHVPRVRAADAGVGQLFGGRLLLAGNSYRGVGVADAVANGLQAGREAVARAMSSHTPGTVKSA